MQTVKNYKSVQNTETGCEEVMKCPVPLLFSTTHLQLSIYLRAYLLPYLLAVYVAYTYVNTHTEIYDFVIYQKYADKIYNLLEYNAM